ncbi:polygalacturonase 1 beta-like protein 3 [Fagus crenata]
MVGSSFTGYGQKGNAVNDTFTNYGNNDNNPQNNSRSYSDGGNSAVDNFKNYRETANVGDDSFQSYTKGSNAAKVNFVKSTKEKFSGYGQGSRSQVVDFKIYGVNNTFKNYAKKGVTFAKYTNVSKDEKADSLAVLSGSLVKKWVESGKFFRESMIKKGNVMPMPDIRDKMPKRSFLPRLISSKLPFLTLKISEMKQIFHADDNSTMESMIVDSLSDCERAPSPGETKRCVSSAEDMIEFAISILGRNVAVRTIQTVSGGSRQKIMIGSVKGINGGKVTQSASCHQSLFPYLLYYCHFVPKVWVYEADILDPSSKEPRLITVLNLLY